LFPRPTFALCFKFNRSLPGVSSPPFFIIRALVITSGNNSSSSCCVKKLFPRTYPSLPFTSPRSFPYLADPISLWQGLSALISCTHEAVLHLPPFFPVRTAPVVSPPTPHHTNPYDFDQERPPLPPSISAVFPPILGSRPPSSPWCARSEGFPRNPFKISVIPRWNSSFSPVWSLYLSPCQKFFFRLIFPAGAAFLRPCECALSRFFSPVARLV